MIEKKIKNNNLDNLKKNNLDNYLNKNLNNNLRSENVKMKDLDELEKPQEKFKVLGPSKMSDSELLALVLRTGTKDCRITEITKILLKDNDLVNLLDMNIKELKKVKGIGEVKAYQIKAICELAHRFEKTKRKQRLELSSPKNIANYARCDLKMKNFEILKIYYLNARLDLMFEEEFTSESPNYINFPARGILKKAIINDVTSIVLLHNHPGGVIMPSSHDVESTKRILQMCKILNIHLEDHIIINDETYFSMREEGIVDFDIY